MDDNFFGVKKVFGFVGLGLMGGSIAMAIKNNSSKILAYDKNTQALDDAKSRGIITEAYNDNSINKMLSECDVVFICLYPEDTISFLNEHKNHFKSNAIITDIAGVKSKLYQNAPKELLPQKGTNAIFIPGHPMAGGEKEGFLNADKNYFINRNYILLPFENTPVEKITYLEKLIYDMGFKRIIKTTAQNHDHKIAFTSQLCHVIASCLVESAEDTNITEFGGGSFEDLTRIAMINAPLWTELFLTNKEELIHHIENFESSLCKIKSFIKNEEDENLKNYLQSIREKRIEMSKK